MKSVESFSGKSGGKLNVISRRDRKKGSYFGAPKFCFAICNMEWLMRILGVGIIANTFFFCFVPLFFRANIRVKMFPIFPVLEKVMSALLPISL